MTRESWADASRRRGRYPFVALPELLIMLTLAAEGSRDSDGSFLRAHTDSPRGREAIVRRPPDRLTD
jgi:hypothetical protein